MRSKTSRYQHLERVKCATRFFLVKVDKRALHLFNQEWRQCVELQNEASIYPALLYLIRTRPRLRQILPTYLRVVKALRLPSEPLCSTDPPDIHLLIVTTGKDFPTLASCITAATLVSGNPISEIIVVVPESELLNPYLSQLNESIKCPLTLISEDEVISLKDREQLREKFKGRYGWVLQQLITTSLVSHSKAAGVLALDSDTILTSSRVMLDSAGIQILTPTYELHEPYYKFLEAIGLPLKTPVSSFVPHSMIMQPEFMSEALSTVGCGSITDLVGLILDYADSSESSAICVEFELYAQYMRSFRPEMFVYAKWANIELGRSESLNQLHSLRKFLISYGRWASVSIHSYHA